MKAQLAQGFVPYEKDDIVKLKNDDTLWKVVEIRLIQYVYANTAEITLQLVDASMESKVWQTASIVWVTADKIEKRIIQ